MLSDLLISSHHITQSIDGQTYPVFITEGVKEERLRITIQCDDLNVEYYNVISDNTAEILSSASTHAMGSTAFHEWLIEHISMELDGAQVIFFFGKNKFMRQSKSASASGRGGTGIGQNVSGQRMINDIGDVIRAPPQVGQVQNFQCG